MKIEPIGLLVLAVGCLGWLIGPTFAIFVFVGFTLLGAAAAIILTGFGSASIQPASLMLGFLVLSAVADRRFTWLALRALRWPKAGFWLALVVAYAFVSAVLFPRLFAGQTYVYAISRAVLGPGVIATIETPLAPTTGNITQPVYLLADFVCFLIFYNYACKPATFKAITQAILVAAALNIVFALLDIATYETHTEFLLSGIRNATYSMLYSVDAFGFKRVVGSHTEASAFAGFTLGYLTFCTSLWLDRVQPRLTGPLALISLAAIAVSFSTTGYFGIGVWLTAFLLVNAVCCLTRPVPAAAFMLVIGAPLVLTTLTLGLYFDRPVWSTLGEIGDSIFATKLDSGSGKERTRWNAQALKNFTDTYGFGAGAGSVRGSSFPGVVLGNMGIVGALAFGGFFTAVLAGWRDRWKEPYPAACQRAARWACFTHLVGASAAATMLDLGLSFFVFAGLACGRPALLPATRPVQADSAAAIPAGCSRSIS